MERSHEAYLRIGELGRRTGVSPELLRAWERRYGVIEPSRSKGGFRLYTDEDAERLRAMKTYVDAGIAPAQAARLAATTSPLLAVGTPDTDGGFLPGIARALWTALETLDETAAHGALDRALASFSLELVIGELVVPALRELRVRATRDDAGIASERFASNLIRGRLLGLARGWTQGYGPRAVLACPSGEPDDLELLSLALLLRVNGWRITYLGADTPTRVLAAVARLQEAELVVAGAAAAEPLRAAARTLVELAGPRRVVVTGTGASAELADSVGAMFAGPDLLTAARELGSRARS